MAKSTITDDPVSEQDKFMLRLPAGMRERIKAVAEANNRSMNAEIVGRLEFSLIAHPHAYLIRALLDLHERLLAGKDEIEIPHDLQNEVRQRATERGVSAQRFVVSLILEALNQLDEKTPLGEEIDQRIRELRDSGFYK